jgi:hypothetical protein
MLCIEKPGDELEWLDDQSPAQVALWLDKMRMADSHQVARTEVCKDALVTTVFLGCDMAPEVDRDREASVSQPYETRVWGSAMHGTARMAATRELAMVVHQAMVEAVEEKEGVTGFRANRRPNARWNF